jgi:hypothetical protein
LFPARFLDCFLFEGGRFPVFTVETFHQKKRKQIEADQHLERVSLVSWGGNRTSLFPDQETGVFPGVFPDPVSSWEPCGG